MSHDMPETVAAVAGGECSRFGKATRTACVPSLWEVAATPL